MKSSMRILLAVVCICMGLLVCHAPGEGSAWAAERMEIIKSDGYLYRLLEDGTAEIMGRYGQTPANLEIPDTLDGILVTSIW